MCYPSSVATTELRTLQPGDVLSARDAAREIGVHFTTVYRWVLARDIVYITFGGCTFIPVLEVERLKREKNKKPTAAKSGTDEALSLSQSQGR